MSSFCPHAAAAALVLILGAGTAFGEAPPFTDYCQRLQQEIQGKKHGFLAGNVTYYVGGFHASWELKEHETLGLTHPFHHDLRSRGVGLVRSRGQDHNDTGLGNDFSGWEFYKDTCVLYGSVVIDQSVHRYPVPKRMYWRPDRMNCEYEVDGVQLREEKFIAANDAACTIISASRPVTLRFDGRSFFGRHSLKSTATIEYDADHNAIHIAEGGTTRCRPETDRTEHVGPIMYQGMSTVTGHDEDIEHWKRLVPQESDQIHVWFDQRWNANGHEHFFAGPKNGMLMTTGFWHMRSKHFPRDYALPMTRSWALDKEKGFFGDFFPLAMSSQTMDTFATDVDHSFGYTPDTAYFTLDGMFRQRLGDPAWRLTLNHLENYNFSVDWNVPVAPEAYTRSGKLFGDQYSNFNAGKLLLYLEGLAGVEYSIPDNRFVVHDTMPTEWKWMEIRVPLQLPGEKTTRWPTVRYERSRNGSEIVKSIRVADCPLRITIEPWSEERQVIQANAQPSTGAEPSASDYPYYSRFTFGERHASASVELRLGAEATDK